MGRNKKNNILKAKENDTLASDTIQTADQSAIDTGELKEESAEQNAEIDKQFVVFKLDDQEYGIDIMQVYEINRLKEIIISPVPKTPDFVEGIINLRGEIVPIINLRKKLELTDKEIDSRARVLVIKIDKKMIGLLVDEVNQVIDVHENDIMSPPEEAIDISTRYLVGVIKTSKEIVLLLDLNEILFNSGENQTQKAV